MTGAHASHRAVSPAGNGRHSTLWICSAGGLVGLLLVGGLAWSLETRQRAADERWANETVAAQVAQARADLARGQRDRAITILEAAVATTHATDPAGAPALLHQCQVERVEDLFDSAWAAVRQKDVGRAIDRLNQYRLDPLAVRKEQAAQLLTELDQASSDEQARAFLKQLPQTALAVLALGEEPAGLEHRYDEALRAVFVETLQRNLPGERQRRQAVADQERERRAAEQRAQEEKALGEEAARRAQEQRLRQAKARQIARLSATPVFRELTEWAALVRQQDREQRPELPSGDSRLLTALLDGNAAADSAALQRLQQELGQRGQDRDRENRFKLWQAGVEEKVSARRAEAKERFRTYRESGPVDWPVFDRLVDRELDRLLEEVRRPFEDDFAAGLRALTGK